MKKLSIAILTILCSGISIAQTTATEFTTDNHSQSINFIVER
jgi:hypothetical protein